MISSRIELETFSVLDWCDNQLHHEIMLLNSSKTDQDSGPQVRVLKIHQRSPDTMHNFSRKTLQLTSFLGDLQGMAGSINRVFALETGLVLNLVNSCYAVAQLCSIVYTTDWRLKDTQTLSGNKINRTGRKKYAMLALEHTRILSTSLLRCCV